MLELDPGLFLQVKTSARTGKSTAMLQHTHRPNMGNKETRKELEPVLNNHNGRKQSKLGNYWLGAATSISNRFEKLQMDAQDADVEKEIINKETKSPIFVAGVSNIQPLTTT